MSPLGGTSAGKVWCCELNMLTKCCRKLSSNDHYYYIARLKAHAMFGFRLFMRILGPLMFLLAHVLIISVFVIFILFMLPFYDTIWKQTMYFTIAVFLLSNILFNYTACALTPAGSPGPCEDPGVLLGERVVMVEGRRQHYINTRFEICPAVSYRFCRECKCIKPPRAHHDRYDNNHFIRVNLDLDL